MAGDLRGTAGRVNVLLDGAQPQVQRLLQDSAALVEELRKSRAQLDQVLASAQVALGDEGATRAVRSTNALMERGSLILQQSQEEIDETLAHLRDASDNLSAFSQRIREDPSLLLRGGEEKRPREASDR